MNRNYGEGNLFLHDFKSETKRVGERNHFWKIFKKVNRNGSERNLFLNDFKKYTKKTCERNLFLKYLKSKKKSLKGNYFSTIFYKVVKHGIWTKTIIEKFLKTDHKTILEQF